MLPSLERNVEMLARDGCVLRSDIYRDATASEERPVLLMRTPYDKSFSQLGIYPHPFWFVSHGFIVIMQDCRGRFASDGDFYPFRNEREDGYDAVEWAAGVPGSNGKVGMYGASYAGATQFLAASGAPPSLAAIAPAVTSAEFGEGWFYEGGAFHLAFGAYWAAQLGEETFRRQGDHESARKCRWAMANLANWIPSASPIDLEPVRQLDYFRDWLSHEPGAEYWRSLSARPALRSVSVPALHIAGWYDIFLNGSVSAYQAMRESPAKDQQHLVIGPWSHFPFGTDAVGELRHVEDAAGALDARHRDFFKKYLLGCLENELPQAELFPIQGTSWVAPSDVDRFLTGMAGTETGTWPLSSDGSASRSLGVGRLGEGEKASTDSDFTSYHGRYALPSVGGHSCFADQSLPMMGPSDRTSLDRWYEVLVYRGDVATEDQTLGGPVVANLRVTCTSPTYNVHAALSVETATGVFAVAEGITRVVNDSLDLSRTSPVVVSLRVSMFTLKEGQRLRLEVSGGSYPLYARESNSGRHWSCTDVDDMTGMSMILWHKRDCVSSLHIGVGMDALTREEGSVDYV